MKYQWLVSTLLVLSCQLGFGVVQAEPRKLSDRGESLDRIVAVVNDGVILDSELNAEIARIVTRLKQQNTELPSMAVLRSQILDRLIQQELQLQRAEKGGLHVTDDMLNTSLSEVAANNGVKFSDLPATIEAQGLSYATYREEMRRDIALQIMQHDVVSKIRITPRELDQALARQARTPDANAQYNLSHILISVPSDATPEQLAQREQRATEVVSKIQAGQSFAELAVSYSDSSTNVEGGNLGWRSGTQLPSIIADRVPGLQPGQLTEIIRSPSGFHIFRLNDKRGDEAAEELQSQVHARHILLKTTEIEDDNTVKQRLEKIRARVLAGEDFAAIAAVTSQDTGSAVQGGDLGWAGPGTYVGEFEKVSETLNENEISEPFKSQFGWHIVQLLGRRTQDI
ncbi:MAG: peptidylprolyl isomerase, partial [Steroidobacteraceae bacterium]